MTFYIVTGQGMTAFAPRREDVGAAVDSILHSVPDGTTMTFTVRTEDTGGDQRWTTPPACADISRN